MTNKARDMVLNHSIYVIWRDYGNKEERKFRRERNKPNNWSVKFVPPRKSCMPNVVRRIARVMPYRTGLKPRNQSGQSMA